ncbi:MAG TPA: hypothetical protein VKV23_07865 [Acidimicrobiales bacterium]|nr:hypothetical protein [Acidimicrobiales bacterium]
MAMAPTPDGGGYWLATANGGVLNFGDAPFCGSAVHDHLRRPVVAIAPTPDGGGYWLATANGVVRCFGDAGCFGSLSHPRRPVVAIAPTPDGRGYWLATADGGVHNFGDAGFFGSAVHVRKPRPIVAMAATPDGGGYLLAGSSGRVYNFGDARFAGSLAHAPPRRPTHVVDLVTTLAVPAAEVVALPHHVFGYDVSNFQCARRDSHAASTSLPRTSKLTIIEVAGWLDNADNPCLAAEAAWATRAAGADGAPYELYLFVNAPDRSAEAARLGASGPHGTCANLAKARAACIAYNYGYNGARQAFVYAASQKVHSLLWWLDVEGAQLSPDAYSNFAAGQYWSASPALNDETIQGAIDGLRADGVRVGIYSTSVQYAQIAGDFVPAGARVPLWVAGVVWTRPPFTEAGLAPTSALAPWCAGTARYLGTRRSDLFAGGVPWILQETPGTLPSPYGLDPDYTC